MSSGATPPTFQEADHCDVCHCTFSAFRRRHHCRCCGRTLCHEHSSYFMALPQFGIFSNVRVCYDCFNNSSRSEKAGTNTSEDIVSTADEISRMNIADDVIKKPDTSFECKCGMPLCICEAPKPDAAPPQKNSVPSSQSNVRPKKAISAQQSESALKKPSSSSSSKPSSFLGQGSITSTDKPPENYDVSGEGLREAIKNGDVAAVKKLLSEGVDANYCDKQGLTLLHLAALFNQTEIVFILMENGANVECKNAQGETPMDCAPTMLQYKMRNKIEEMSNNREDN